jgi:hypothetical protein
MLAKAVARLQTIDIEKLTPVALAQWVDVATKIERQAVGGDIATLTHTGPDGGPIQIEGTLGDDELSLLAELKVIASVLSERIGEDEQAPVSTSVAEIGGRRPA